MGAKLNVGAGLTYIPGFVNIDVSPKADVTLDLSQDVLPFDDSSVDLVFSYHTLEHLENYLFALGEIHRVLRHGGRFLLGLPYATHADGHLVNPYHRHSFNESSFDFFEPKKSKGSAVEENPILFIKVFHRFHYIGIFNLVPPPFRSWCRRHLLNVVRKTDFGLVAIKQPEERIPMGAEVRRRLKQEFLQCQRARTFYDTSIPKRGEGLPRSLRRPAKTLYGVWKWWRGHDH